MNTSPFINSDLNKQAQALEATLSRTTNSYHSETSGFEFGNKNSFAKNPSAARKKAHRKLNKKSRNYKRLLFLS